MANPSRLSDVLSAVSRSAPESQYIRAYHGGPHDFDRFDSRKIGTGEGAQAYGHGLYFSGAEPVAKWYRDQLSGPPDLIIGGEPVRWIAPTKTPRERALRLLQKSAIPYYENPTQAVREAMLDASDQYGGRDAKAVIDSLMRLKSDGVAFGPRKGKVYEVEIGHPEDALLDYDRPFATLGGINGAAVLRQEKPAVLSERMLRALQDGSWRFESYAGWQNAAEELARLPNTPGGARALMEAGVPGVRYFDGSSRGAAEGTRNYVMFPGTEDSIRILRKYGLLAPIAAGAAMGEE